MLVKLRNCRTGCYANMRLLTFIYDITFGHEREGTWSQLKK